MSDLTRVTTLYKLPDGGLIDVFIRNMENGTFEVTDAGETLGWIRQNSVTPIRSEAQNERIVAVLCSDPDVAAWQQMERHGRNDRLPLEIRQGEIVALATKVTLEAVIDRVARTCAAVAAAGLP